MISPSQQRGDGMRGGNLLSEARQGDLPLGEILDMYRTPCAALD